MTISRKQTIKSIEFLSVGALIVGVSIFELFGAANSVAARFSESHSVAPIITTKQICSADDTDSRSTIPTKITIAKANINLPVVQQTLTNGTWSVANGVANYAMETSRVSSKTGNVGIFGHDLANAFTRIKTLHNGDIITVTTAGGQTATYKVTSVAVIDPTNVQTFNPTPKPTLTLITCDGIFSQQRYAVKAELVSLKKGNCNAKTS